MKSLKSILAVGLSLVAMSAAAQFSVKAGYANTAFRMKGEESESTNGFKVGAAYDIALPVKGLSLRPGVDYVFAADIEKRSSLLKTTVMEHSIAIPVDLKYAFRISDSFRIYAFAGPGFSVGLAMPVKYEFSGSFEHFGLGDVYGYISHDLYSGETKTNLSDEVLNTVPFPGYMNQDTYSRFDITMGLGVGVEYKRLFLEFDYDFGLLDRYKKYSGKERRDQLAVAVGVTF